MRIRDWSSDVCSSVLGAGIETGAHLQHRLSAGGELEMVGAGHALAVQQGVDLDAAGPGLRLLQPELAEVGKLLLLGEAGVDGETAGGQTVLLPGGHHAKIARAKEDRSAERRGGKGCVSTCRSRWSPEH